MENWNGFSCERFVFEEYPAIVVFPENGKKNGKVAIKTEYWDAFPEALEIPLLHEGFHLCYIQNQTRFGMPDDLARKARFLQYVCEKYDLDTRCVPVGMSCGGLVAIQFAAAYPELVSCLYLDAPVVNYMSWPCGFGVGRSACPTGDYSEILNALKLDNLSQLIAYRGMPLDRIPVLVEHKIPIVMVAGGSDMVVPYCENGIFVQKAYEEAGLDIEVYIKPECDHHPHGLEEPRQVVDFIMRHMFTRFKH